MTPGIAKRERIAERLWKHIGYPLFTGQDIEDIIGVQRSDFDAVLADVSYRRLADLVDPSAWRAVVEDNERLLERCRELEKENYALKSGGRWRGGRS